MTEPVRDPAAVLRRWEDSGGVWRVLARGERGVTVSLCQCTGGEEVERLTSSDPELLTFLGDREASDE